MTELQFFIRHQTSFLQDKMILVFKSDEARDYIQAALDNSRFEEITSESAEHAARIGIKGNVIPFGYTWKLTDIEKEQINTANWEITAQLLAEGNERLYQEMVEKEGESGHEKSSN